MATPAQLMQTISGATGVPLATVVDLDRKLVKAGLRTKAGRGFSAARMTTLDAARLLTAVLASAQANAAVDAVERYQRTHCDKDYSSEDQFGATKPEELTSLPVDHSFVDALAALIAAISAGSLVADADRTPHIEVFALTRATRGRIRVSGLPNGLTVSMEYVPPPIGLKGRSSRGKRHMPVEQPVGDLEQSRRVTEQTVFAVAAILAEEQP